jgi:hypothetical protein
VKGASHSEGFENASILSGKVVNLYKLCTKWNMAMEVQPVIPASHSVE